MMLDQRASPELKEIRGQLARLEQGLQTSNAAVEELKEEIRNMATVLQEMKKQVGVTYETVSINSLLEWKKQEKQEKEGEAGGRQEAAGKAASKK